MLSTADGSVSERPRRYGWEDYLYPPGPDGVQVLRNHLGLTDLAQWHVAERVLTRGRHDELLANPHLVPQTFDAAHWKAIHRHLFQDMYAWAGEFRTVNMANGGHVFLDEDSIEAAAEGFLANVRDADLFAGRDRVGVVQGLAATLQGINLIHPFREGNGRTQRLLTDHIAAQAGYLLDWERMDPAVQNEVMARSFDGELTPLREALAQVVVPRIRGGAVDEPPGPAVVASQERAPDFWRFSRPLEESLGRSTTTPPGAHVVPAVSRGLEQDPGLGR